MKIIKVMASLVLSFVMLYTVGPPTAFAAEGDGWIEVRVSVPENFKDQIYIQFQEEGNVDEAFFGNSVQVLPENNYVGRIQVPEGTYEVAMKSVFEHPLIYKVELSPETDYPIVVKSDSAATLVEFECTVVPIEELPEIEGEYPPEIIAAAQKSSDEAKLKEDKQDESEKLTDKESNSEEIISSEPVDDSGNENNEDEKRETNDSPLVKIVKGVLSSVVFFGVACVIGLILYKSKRN